MARLITWVASAAADHAQPVCGGRTVVYAQNATSNDKFTAVENACGGSELGALLPCERPILARGAGLNVELVDRPSRLLHTVPRRRRACPECPRAWIAASPFELTLALDSHATAALTGAAALMREHQLVVDLPSTSRQPLSCAARPVATGRAMISSLWGAHARAHKRLPPPWRWPNRPGRDVAPQSFVEMLPHNWALLVRRSAGGRALLARWAFALRCANCGWTDQYALQAVLWYLNATRSAADQNDDHVIGRADGVPVRVMRLRELQPPRSSQ